MQSLIRRGSQLAAGRAFALRNAVSASYASSANQTLEKEFLVYRWDPDEGQKPEYKSYKVDLNS